MRVEAASYAFRTTDRRRREETRADAQERRKRSSERRARHVSMPWLGAPFATQLIGQVVPEAAPEAMSAKFVMRAYAQPEARTPLRPRHAATA